MFPPAFPWFPKPSKVPDITGNPITLEEEATFISEEENLKGSNPTGKYVFPHTESEQLKALVNGPLYPALRKFLMYEAMAYYRDSRLKTKLEEKMMMDDRGNHLVDLVKNFDSLKSKKPETTEDDWT